MKCLCLKAFFITILSFSSKKSDKVYKTMPELDFTTFSNLTRAYKLLDRYKMIIRKEASM